RPISTAASDTRSGNSFHSPPVTDARPCSTAISPSNMFASSRSSTSAATAAHNPRSARPPGTACAVAAEAAAHPAAAGQIPWIYAFSPERDAVVRVRLDGAGRETLLRLEPGAAGEFLLARPNAEGAWDLWVDPAPWPQRPDAPRQSAGPE